MAPIAASPRATATSIKPNVDGKAFAPNSSTSPVPLHTNAATGITMAAPIKKTRKKERVSRQHFQRYIAFPFAQAPKKFPGGLGARHALRSRRFEPSPQHSLHRPS